MTDSSEAKQVWIDPELLALIELFPDLPDFSTESLPGLRDGGIPLLREPTTLAPFYKIAIPGPMAAPDVNVVVINSKPGTQKPVILHMHGGGFVIGDTELMLADLQDIAVELNCVVVSVEYRLAPEAIYADSIADNYAALAWLHGNATDLGVDPDRIALLGESAGGGHAALLAIKARNEGDIPILFQALVQPMLDDRTGSSRAAAPHTGQYIWTAASNRFGWQSFLGQPPGSDSVPAEAVPARTENLSGLPPTWIGVGALDLFVEEDIAFASRLTQVGVATELLVVPGAFHGFDVIAPDADVAKRFTRSKVQALARAFAGKL